MARRPPRSPYEATEAARRIHQRRNARHGSDEAQLPEPTDLWGMVRHVHRHQRSVPGGTLRADFGDCTIILDYLDRALDRERGASLALAARLMSLTDLADAVGLNSRQAVKEWMDRLATANEGGIKEAAPIRAERRAEREARTRALAAAEAARAVWAGLVTRRRHIPADLLDDMRALAHARDAAAAVIRARHLVAELASAAVDEETRAFARAAIGRLSPD